MLLRSRKASTIEQIVDDLMLSLSEEDRAFIRSRQPDLGMVGRHIRNHYGLWDPRHPLTKRWHEDPSSRVIIDGIDHSPDHPDAVSGGILRLLRQRLTV